MLVLSGHARIRINLRDYSARKSDTLMVSPNCLKQFVSFSDDFSFTLISFSSRTLTWLGIDGKVCPCYYKPFRTNMNPGGG